ncbi:MAG: iron dependent repressor, metal binding and dimerization domain protein [Archaeoglobaceae archaeon]
MERVEDYLEAIYDIQTAEKRMVKTNDLSKKLNIRPSSVTEMLSKLSEMNYVEYQPYYGVYLTEEGEKYASKIKRYHRIFETFFKDFLEIDEEEAFKLSCELEHHVNDAVAEKVCGVIASSDCEICEECNFNIHRLSEVGPGTYEVIFSPASAVKIGISPGTIVELNDSGAVNIDGEEYQINPKVSSKIIVEGKS